MPEQKPIFKIKKGSSPIVMTAIHDGHEVREELIPKFKLTDDQRLREEDPFTGIFAELGPNQIIGLHSRFEVDLNRPRDKAVYQKPEDAWGLDIWKTTPDQEAIRSSLERYDHFYREIKGFLDQLVAIHGCFVVYDIHSYNHRRQGPDAEPDNPDENPEVNIGTGNTNRQLWGPLIDRLEDQLREVRINDQPLDVRENVKFKGGYFSQWIHEQYGDRCCVIAIEFKKIFMDEWTGQPDHDVIQRLKTGLESTIPVVMKQYETICNSDT